MSRQESKLVCHTCTWLSPELLLAIVCRCQARQATQRPLCDLIMIECTDLEHRTIMTFYMIWEPNLFHLIKLNKSFAKYFNKIQYWAICISILNHLYYLMAKKVFIINYKLSACYYLITIYSKTLKRIQSWYMIKKTLLCLILSNLRCLCSIILIYKAFYKDEKLPVFTFQMRIVPSIAPLSSLFSSEQI